jgi:hypothetical protein
MKSNRAKPGSKLQAFLFFGRFGRQEPDSEKAKIQTADFTKGIGRFFLAPRGRPKRELGGSAVYGISLEESFSQDGRLKWPKPNYCADE